MRQLEGRYDGSLTRRPIASCYLIVNQRQLMPVLVNISVYIYELYISIPVAGSSFLIFSSLHVAINLFSGKQIPASDQGTPALARNEQLESLGVWPNILQGLALEARYSGLKPFSCVALTLTLLTDWATVYPY